MRDSFCRVQFESLKENERFHSSTRERKSFALPMTLDAVPELSIADCSIKTDPCPSGGFCPKLVTSVLMMTFSLQLRWVKRS
jgi:hypothetical protein